MRIILASTSPYRKVILEKLGITFTTVKPNIDESPFPNETASELVKRLASCKAAAISSGDDTFVIGSDQVATIDGEILGKPHTVENAVAQLSRFSGRAVTFYTGLSLKKGNDIRTIVEPFIVEFRSLTLTEIHHYIKQEQPLNCAGSFKSEGLGVLLFSGLQGRDPNALIGLPVIALNELFTQYGFNLLTDATKLS